MHGMVILLPINKFKYVLKLKHDINKQTQKTMKIFFSCQNDFMSLYSGMYSFTTV